VPFASVTAQHHVDRRTAGRNRELNSIAVMQRDASPRRFASAQVDVETIVVAMHEKDAVIHRNDAEIRSSGRDWCSIRPLITCGKQPKRRSFPGSKSAEILKSFKPLYGISFGVVKPRQSINRARCADPPEKITIVRRRMDGSHEEGLCCLHAGDGIARSLSRLSAAAGMSCPSCPLCP